MPGTTVTGIDIGSTAIRVVEITRGKADNTVGEFGSIELPDGAVNGGLVIDPAAVTAALKKLWSDHSFKNKKVVLGVTGAQVLVREVTLPKLPPKELKQTLPFQVREQLPMPVEKAMLDFFPLEEKEDGTVHGLVVAAPKENVLTMVRAVEKAGLTVSRVDLASFAIMRSAARMAAPVEALVDVGAHASSVVVHTNGRPLIVRSVPHGGADVTALLSERLGVSHDEAEALKRRFGLQQVALHQLGQAAAPNQDANITRVAGVVAEALRPLISEIRSSFAYVKSIDNHAGVANVALTGGGAMLPGLIERLADEFDVDVFLADPLLRLNESRRRGKHNELSLQRSSAAISIGLTLGAA